MNRSVEECYLQMAGDYEGVLSRLRNPERIEKYLGKFLKDTNFEKLGKALEEKEYSEAFMAVHNLKGLSQNLSFTPLENSTAVLCEALREGKVPEEPELAAMWQRVQEDYERTVAAVKQLQEA